jgi:bacterioferritin-associated ferredoxin
LTLCAEFLVDIDFHFQPPTLCLAMIVCHCHAVSDRAIRRAVRDGATSSGEVTRACAAGGCCGGCKPRIDSILDHELRAQPRAESTEPASIIQAS